jgi:D-3-phosphoglycerate dehydrogenase
MARILMLSNVARSFPGFAEARAALVAAGHEVIDPGARFLPQEEVAGLIGEIDGVLVGGTHQLREPALVAAARLQVIVREGIGIDNIDVDVATSLGIVVGNTAGSNAESVADHAFGLMLAIVRRLFFLDEETRKGRGWEHRPPLEQIAGKTIGVVGTGNVGSAVIRRAAGFGMGILGNDLAPNPRLEADYGVRYVPLDQLLLSADIVTLHVPLTGLTRGMIGEAELAQMKPSALLINTARGEVVDSAAVADALRDGRLGGVGIDAWSSEPVVDSELFAIPGVIATPHVGGNSTQSSFNARTWGARNLLLALDGRPRDVVNPEVLDTPALRLPMASTTH